MCVTRSHGRGRTARPRRPRCSTTLVSKSDGITELEIFLKPDAAQSIAVVLHELATNAAKYGALSGTEGRVELTWSQGPDGRLVLRWTEQDGSQIAAPKRQGFGTRVINQMVRHQLKGQLRLDWSAEGLACEVSFPMGDHTFSRGQAVDH
jgi:two-component sensor histidine kinase